MSRHGSLPSSLTAPNARYCGCILSWVRRELTDGAGKSMSFSRRYHNVAHQHFTICQRRNAAERPIDSDLRQRQHQIRCSIPGSSRTFVSRMSRARLGRWAQEEGHAKCFVKNWGFRWWPKLNSRQDATPPSVGSFRHLWPGAARGLSGPGVGY